MAAATLLALVGCYLPSDEEPAPEGAKCGAVGVRNAGLRLLTRAEYDATVADLLGDRSAPARDFPKEPLAFGFENNADVLRVTADGAQRYVDAAETLAARSVRERRDEVTGCRGLDGLACAERMLDTLGRRVFRRKLTDDEKASLLDLYRRGTMGGETSDGGLEMVLTAMLQSPQFLYRTETGEAPEGSGPARLSGYELASRLSYFLWGTMPDEELLDAAEHGRLATQAGVRAEAERMMDDPRAHAGSASFFRQYLSLETMQSVEKDTTAYPVFTHALAGSWRTSLERFTDDTFWNGKNLHALLTAPAVFVDAQFAAAYGMTAPSTGGFVRTVMAENRYAGLIAQPGMMARLAGPNQSSPIRRGVFIFDKLLCQPLPPPPAELNVTAPEPSPTATTRERFDVHSKNAVCAGCHKMIDPMGFGVEEYDGLGAYRARENGKPVDNSGEVVGARDEALNGKYSGALELGEKLGRSKQVHDCFATHYVRFALGRSEKEEDKCSMQQVQHAFYGSGGDFRTLVVGIATSDSFRFRSPPPGETKP